MYSPFSLEGKTILVTGASSGIGRATAVECSRMGAAVVLNGRNPERLDETLSLMEGSGHAVVAADLATDEGIAALAETVPELDGVACNAGVSKMAPVQFYTQADLDRLFGVNAFSPMLLLKHLVRRKRLRNPSSVVFTASIAGHSNVLPANGMYGASKAALSAYMKYAAAELAGRGIRCNAVHPGVVDTPMVASGAASQADLEKDIERYPLKRHGRPEDVAWAIAYLLSDASAWVTGASLVVDGGRSLK